MRLSPEQQKMVEENHKLIFWYIHLKGLSVKEWYDIFAIELCETVYEYNEELGSLSNYFKMKCDQRLANEYKRQFTDKRSHNGMYPIHDMEIENDMDDIEEYVHIRDSLDIESDRILKMRYYGYTQQEIADELGLSQSTISNILKEIRDEYEKYNDG